jgi:hypothetical protein
VLSLSSSSFCHSLLLLLIFRVIGSENFPADVADQTVTHYADPDFTFHLSPFTSRRDAVRDCFSRSMRDRNDARQELPGNSLSPFTFHSKQPVTNAEVQSRMNCLILY